MNSTELWCLLERGCDRGISRRVHVFQVFIDILKLVCLDYSSLTWECHHLMCNCCNGDHGGGGESAKSFYTLSTVLWCENKRFLYYHSKWVMCLCAVTWKMNSRDRPCQCHELGFLWQPVWALALVNTCEETEAVEGLRQTVNTEPTHALCWTVGVQKKKSNNNT